MQKMDNIGGLIICSGLTDFTHTIAVINKTYTFVRNIYIMALMMEAHADEIFEMLGNGTSILKISEHFGCSRTAIDNILESNPARATIAIKKSADGYADKAEKVLLDNEIDIARARELAHHYRWAAKMFNKSKYSDKIEVEHSGQVNVKKIGYDTDAEDLQ